MEESNEGSVATMIRVEDEKNQTKRVKTEDIVKADEDRISMLPDCLAVEILSRLPSTKESFRTCILSKRWINVWTPVSNLIFLYGGVDLPGSDFISFVDKTLSQHYNLKLKKFELYSSYGNSRLKTKYNDWIRYAIKCNVEELILNLRSQWNLSFGVNFKLDQSFFDTSCFTHLELSGCIFNSAPAISWKNLKTLCISYGKLNEETIKNILNGSPMLDTLVLKFCYGYRRLNITSKSVKNLVFHGYRVPSVPDPDPDFPDHLKYLIEINAPYILSLEIVGFMDFNLSNLLLLDVTSLVKANLDFGKCGADVEKLLEGLIPSLRHVKELTIGDDTLEVLSNLKAKGFVFPPNMKYLHVPSPKQRWRGTNV